MPPSNKKPPTEPLDASAPPASETPDVAQVPDDASHDAGEPVDEPEQVDEAPASDWPVMSAGVASDLAMQGWAGDPGSGGMWRRDPETGEDAYTPRA
jgi:hypothetical protein